MGLNVDVLVATLPYRRASVERLLVAIAGQSVVPSRTHLVLDGYGDKPPPVYPSSLSVVEHRTPSPSGPGARWRILAARPSDADVLVVLDDDRVITGKDVVEKLVAAATSGGAAAHFGINRQGWGSVFPAGRSLISMGAAAMALRPSDIADLDATHAEIVQKCGFDPYADGGDDEAVVAAHLWRNGVPMRASGPLAISMDRGAQSESQLGKRQARRGGRSLFWQREEIARVTGWPWVTVSARC